MGICAALMEERCFDERSGRIANPSLAEYHVPVNADVPRVETYYLDIPDPHTAMGAHGVGEIGITGVAAAVANAVFHATGKRVRDLPITLDKLLYTHPRKRLVVTVSLGICRRERGRLFRSAQLKGDQGD